MHFSDFRAVYLPYCIRKQPDGRYAVLNRHYKPVGFCTDDWIEYENYPVLVKLRGLGPAIARKISCDGDSSTETIYLYGDGCNPVRNKATASAYFARLSRLMKLEIPPL